jgi:acetyl esterase
MNPLSLLAKLPAPVVRALAGGRIEIDGQLLDSQSQMINRVIGIVSRPLGTQSPAEARRGMTRLQRLGPRSPVRDKRDRTVSGPAGPIRIRSYHPPGVGPRAPALVFFHGGGWVVGSIEGHDAPCGDLARRAGCVVVSVDYRLAPEHPYPAAMDDAYGAYLAVREIATELGIDPDRVAVGGDSAGGNLAAAVCLRCKLEGSAVPAAQLLVYPVTDLSREAPSYELFAEGFLLTRAGMRYFIGHYTPEQSQRLQPLASPLLAEDLSGLPQALVLVAGFDPLRDEGLAYADRLAGAGVAVERQLYETTFHGFFNMAELASVADRAMDAAARWLRSVGSAPA